MLETGSHVPVTHLAPESSTLGELFTRRVDESGHRISHHAKVDGRWEGTNWREFDAQASRIAKGLLALGLELGDKVAVLGPTQPAWVYYEIGAQLAGCVSLGIYPNQPVEALRYVIDHSDTRAIFVQSAPEVDNVLQAIEGNDKVVAVIPWSSRVADDFKSRDPRVMSPKAFEGAELSARDRDARLSAIDPDDPAIFIYTSGTTGPPKGAMITHRNVLSLLSAHGNSIAMHEDDITLSFLPMAHAAERVLSFYGRIGSGVTTAYASSISKVLDELQEVRPTLFGSVPRMFEKMYGRIQTELDKKPPAVQRLFAWALDVGTRRARLELAHKRVPLGLAAQAKVADALVFRKVRGAFGGRVRYFISGAAPIAIEILEFLCAAKMPVLEAYGMTEATCVTHINTPDATRLGSVGQTVKPFEHKIAADGEILVRGPWLFRGYYKNDEATAEALQDGWLHTGDVGRIDADGYLYITDRKKHLIITAGGKNLTPANIENAIKNTDPLISQVHAHGDKRPYISALVAPSPLETLEWGVARGLVTSEELASRTVELMDNPTSRSDALNRSMARVVIHDEFRRRIRDAVSEGNKKLARVEQVRRFAILDRDFSQEHGELTPTMKVKRKAIEEAYQDTFDRVYGEDGFALDA